MYISDRDYSRRTYALFMLMTGALLFAVIYLSISTSGTVKMASRSASIDAAPSLYSGGGAEHTHSHPHGDIVHMHSHPSGVHHK